MDKAKAAVSNFLSKDGKHETTVHETVNPAIENERVLRTEQENAQKVVDREVHQDHHHTSVQPIQHKEVLPESHTHNMVGTEEREFRHGNDEHVRQRLENERAQFKSTREVGDVQHTTTEAPVVAGEHVHHHVHETIQPVVQKETVQPSVVHTTIPVHEVHHNESKHHAASALPAVTMAEFKSQGGVLGGREERSDAFAGEPRAVGSTLGNGGNHHLGGPGAAGSTSVTDGNMNNASGTRETIRDRDGVSGSRGTATTETRGNGLGKGMSQDNTGLTGSGVNSSGATGEGMTTTGTKPTLKDRMNPRVDANGDGKPGFMS